MPEIVRVVATIALPCRGVFVSDVITACVEQYRGVRCELANGCLVIIGGEQVDDSDERLLHSDVQVTP